MLVASTLFAAKSFAQVSATANAGADIVAPIAILKTGDMNFGIVARSNVNGWVQLSAAGVRTTTGGALLLSQTGTVTPATFAVTGEAGYTYAITLPTSVTLTNTTGAGGETMVVENFVSTPTVAAGGVLVAGTQTLSVGGELVIAGNQVSGNYLAGTPFTVTVNYN
ncbi:DUF4402 domain-containing protein [Pedobacter hartonius]|nr:DUF4402 domain-containing protein [Pedobacter hartonius]